MNVEPRNFDRDALVSTLRAWELSVTSLSYLPVGAGAHHYLAVDWAGNVGSSRSTGSSASCSRCWARPSRPGSMLTSRRRSRRSSVRSARPLPCAMADSSSSTNDHHSGRRRAGRLDDETRYRFSHSSTESRTSTVLMAAGGCSKRLAGSTPQLTQFRPGSRNATRSPCRTNTAFSPRSTTCGHRGHPVLTENRRGAGFREKAPMILDMFKRCDELADAVRAADNPWVVTHGQMHPGNIVHTEDDNLLLVDWDTVVVAPRERDMVWGDEFTRRLMRTGSHTPQQHRHQTSIRPLSTCTNTSAPFGNSATTARCSGLRTLTTPTFAASGRTSNRDGRQQIRSSLDSDAGLSPRGP